VYARKEVASLAGQTDCVVSVAFSPDGQYCQSSGTGGDNLVKVWSVSGGKVFASLAGHTTGVMSVAFSPDGQHIVSGSEDKQVGEGVVYVWREGGCVARWTRE
jgi:WD40 repeat protein